MVNINIPIGKLFNIEKGQLQSTKCTPGKFDFITAAEDWKTHNQYNHECEALIFAAAASGSLGRTHYVDGKFISSDLCFILTPKDEKKYPLNLAFYHFVFNSLRPVLVAATKSGTSKESINQTNFKKYDLPYFNIEQQDFWIERLKNTLVRKDLLCSQLTHQQTLLKKLRQQILQEAIQGKLTADFRAQNPDIEPAGELLARIKAEKEQLIKEKKIKKQKPLPPISEEEIPFELPEGWVWCHIGDISFSIVPNRDKPKSFTGSIPWVTIVDIDDNSISLTYKSGKGLSLNETKNYNARVMPEGAVLTGCVGRYGIAALITKSIVANQQLHCFVPLCNVDPAYIAYSIKVQKLYFENIAIQTTLKYVNKTKMESMLLTLPPLSEQKAIVTKVEKLLSICDQLETQITTDQTHTEQLMQAVLKEAFSQSGEA